jgi:epoxide hydrolase-like predicted phosphatase
LSSSAPDQNLVCGKGIAAVVFDVGGVLFPSPLAQFQALELDYQLPQKTVQRFFRGGGFLQVETGREPMASFLERCSGTLLAEHGRDVPAKRLQRMMDDCLDVPIDPVMAALVIELKQAGYHTALMTNLWAERRTWLHNLFPAGTLDVICDSSQIGLSKPDPAIYAHVIRELGLAPPQVALIDDFPENVNAARAYGMTGLLFTDAAQTRRDLSALGVGVPRQGT